LLIKSLKFTFKKTGKQKRIQIFLGTTTDLIAQPSAELLTFNDVPETTFVETSTAELIFSTETTSTSSITTTSVSSTTTTYTTTPPKVKSLKKRHDGARILLRRVNIMYIVFRITSFNKS
jgi:hypothetical protein